METFINELIELLDEKPSIAVDANTEFQELSEWDSLVNLSLIIMVSETYGKSLDGEEIRKCVTISDLFDLINV